VRRLEKVEGEESEEVGGVGGRGGESEVGKRSCGSRFFRNRWQTYSVSFWRCSRRSRSTTWTCAAPFCSAAMRPWWRGPASAHRFHPLPSRCSQFPLFLTVFKISFCITVGFYSRRSWYSDASVSVSDCEIIKAYRNFFSHL
jgi:hypothetical protein